MSRNLLPRFRSKPNPANVEPLPPGRWTVLQNAPELAKIELPAENAEIRTRIQSIPSPWARMQLFRNALEDPQHPARRLVENEVLDALEFVWSLGSARGTHVEVTRVRLDSLRAMAADTGSRRVEDFADALVELAPRRSNGGAGLPAVPTISLLLVNGTPVFASSPYTLLFTAEDAAREETGSLFRYAQGAELRPLAKRPFQFQRYVAQVLLPQLSGTAPEAPEEYVEWQTLQRCVTQWLTAELKSCREGKSERQRDQLSPRGGEGEGWRTAAGALHLEPLTHQLFGGVVLYRRRSGAELDESRWRLRAEPGTRQLPMVVDPESFDGRFFEGAQLVSLPPDLARLDRGVLPGLGLHHPWVNPATDWLTDQVLLLSDPLNTENVKGVKAEERGNYRVQVRTDDPRFAQPRLALPLTGAFFQFFTPDDVERMLAVEVLSNGALSVTLTVPVGSEEDAAPVVIRKVYPETHVRKEYGPQLAVWPAFTHPAWREYTLLRSDRNSFVADHFEVRAYAAREPLPALGSARRTPLVGAVAFGQAPEVLEFRNTVTGAGDRAESLGVILPRYRRANEPNEGRWVVGVDFGTSNTIVSVRKNDDPAAEIFSASDVVLPLTQPGSETRDLLESYFFPEGIDPEAFGTAVVHVTGLPHLDIAKEPLAIRVTVPFDGTVKNETQNRVTGDLKWSPHRETYFLSASFLRHVVATVLSSALRQGIRPENISFTFSYPRSFSHKQVSNLEDQWREVLETFRSRGLEKLRIERGVDESRSALHHFFNAGNVGALGAGDVILDVGGGTTDLAAYGEGRTLLLDSVLFGGKNLTGPRQQSSRSEGLTNPFVEAFSRWALGHDLPDSVRAVVEKYLADRQVHLAFSYLVRTPWFRSGKASLFRATPEFHAFQAMVLYFFGALFHYAGLAFRALPPVAGTDEPRLPNAVILAGNGSQYLNWLSDLRPGAPGDPFRRALASILRDAAGASGERSVSVRVSDSPKEEVARGLVALVSNQNLVVDPLSSGPVAGERLTAQLRNEGEVLSLEPTTRLGPADTFSPERLASLRWLDGETEAERFHASLHRAAESLVPLGDTWTELPDRYRRLFSSMNRDALRQATLNKLEYLANLGGGYRGSIFIVEATVVLERMLDQLFEARS